MKQIFSETFRTIDNLIVENHFEFMMYNFEEIKVMGNVQIPSSSHTYSYVSFQNNLISS